MLPEYRIHRIVQGSLMLKGSEILLESADYGIKLTNQTRKFQKSITMAFFVSRVFLTTPKTTLRDLLVDGTEQDHVDS